MSNHNNNDRNNPSPRRSYRAGVQGNDNSNDGQNPPGSHLSYSYSRGNYNYGDGYQYSPYNPNLSPPAAQLRAFHPEQYYNMPRTQSQSTKSCPDQANERSPTSLDIDLLIQEESAKARAKASIVARKANKSLSSADKKSADDGETTRSQFRGGMFTATNRLSARVDSPMGFPGNTKSPSNLDSFSDLGLSASASQPTKPAETLTISGANSIPLGLSTNRRGGADNNDEAAWSAQDQDIRDWFALSGFHDMDSRNERLESFHQLQAEKKSVVSDIERNQRSASRPQEVMEDSLGEAYMGKVKGLAKRIRDEFPPELLRELIAMETPREPVAPENLYNRVTSREDARERAREMAKKIESSNLPTLQRSPSPYVDHYNDQRQERVQDHGLYRDHRDFQTRAPDYHYRRESMERFSDRNREQPTSPRVGSEQYRSRYPTYDLPHGGSSSSRRSRSPNQHMEPYRARPPMRSRDEPRLPGLNSRQISRQINSEGRVRSWQEWKRDYTRRR